MAIIPWLEPQLSVSPTVLRYGDPSTSSRSLEFQEALDDFTARWQRGEPESAEDFLARLDPVAPRFAVELIYREYCLAELAGTEPDQAAFLARFPQYQSLLERLLSLHRQCESSQLRQWSEPAMETVPLPEANDEIGPYILKRELGRGSFARVFLAEQSDLANRHVVVKVSTRPTREPWLLARARHANIVEILSHASVDDGAFQLICMPFLGGATLSAVLARRRAHGPTRSGRGSFLDDLDAVAAAEYRDAGAARPARELLRSLSDAYAMAWITARLAEALDHAFSRDVAHGDVKPSNILLTADGTPMLLDFNLAQDWALSDAGRPVVDPGGTLAYMAPERLQAIASHCRPTAAGPADPHRVDLYALGMVLLEALTLQSPPPAAGDNGAPARVKIELRDLAADFAAFRQRGAQEVIQAAQTRGKRPIAPALRAILERCLAAQPDDRYRRASELAEDLDRWRTDRPLAYASEPFWTHTVPRSMRKKKRVMATAALALMVTLLTTFVVMVKSRSTRQSMALDKLARKWDDADSRAFQFQRPGLIRPQNPDNPRALAAAVSALKDYDVFGDVNWKQRDAIQTLPAQDREDVELWLMEQALRYCRALEKRASSPGDWILALTIVDHVNHDPHTQVFDALREQLIAKLSPSGLLPGRPEGPSAFPNDEGELSGTPRPGQELPGLENYLAGLDSELDDQAGARRPAAESFENASEDMSRPDYSGSRKALDHYRQVLALRPDSFWAHYRASVVCFRLELWPEAAIHLDRCQQRRPNNPTIPALLASCLCELGRLDDAMRVCNRALELAPDHAEYFRSRAFIRAASGKIEGLKSDLERFELLNRLLSRTVFRVPRVQGPGDGDLREDQSLTGHRIDPLVGPQDIDPEDLDTRAALAAAIYRAGGLAIAAAELDKILMLDPNQLRARIAHMTQELQLNHYSAAKDDLEIVMSHNELRDYLCSGSKNSTPLVLVAQKFAARGLTDEAMRIANKLVWSASKLGLTRGQFHYTRAVVLSVAARTDPANLPGAARQLTYAFAANSRFKEWYHQEKLFDPVRVQIDAILDNLPAMELRY